MRSKIKEHFESIANNYDNYKSKNWYYYKSLKNLLKSIIPPNKSVLDVGCGTGDLLVSLSPKRGVGIDLSKKMINIAKRRHPESNLNFKTGDICSFRTSEHFDYIFMIDVIEHLDDVEKSLSNISQLMNRKAVFVNSMINPKWEVILLIAEKLGLKMPEGPHMRISFSQIEKILNDVDVVITDHGFTTLFPVYIPVMTNFINNWIEPLLKQFACIEYFTAQKR